MPRFICGCCNAAFMSDKPQDPEHDRGYGTCPKCQESVAESMAKFGFACRDFTLEEARARLRKYA